MTFLLFVYRHQQIIAEKSRINLRLDNLRQKLMDLQSYAASVADGKVTMSDLMQAPPSMFGQMSLFMMSSSQQAYAGANEKFMQMRAMGGIQQMQDQQTQQMYNNVVFKALFDQQREGFGEQEKKRLNVEDTKIQQEVAKLEDQLKMLDATDTKVTEQESKAAEKGAPSFMA